MPTEISSEELERATAAAERGAKYLDGKLPGWEFDINVRTLDLSSDRQCVLGQLATDIVPRVKWFRRIRRPRFSDAQYTLRLRGKSTEKYGFVSSGISSETRISYPALTKAWRKLVRARLKSYSRG